MRLTAFVAASILLIAATLAYEPMSTIEGQPPSGWTPSLSAALLGQLVTVYENSGSYGLLLQAGEGISEFAAMHIHQYDGTENEGKIVRWLCGSPEWDGGVAQNEVGANAPCCRNWACNFIGVNNPGLKDGEVMPCSSFKPGSSYWITDEHEYLCAPDECSGEAVLGSANKGALTIHGGQFQRFLLPTPLDNGSAGIPLTQEMGGESCGLTSDKPGADVLGLKPLA